MHIKIDCRNIDLRKKYVKEDPNLNGVDYLEAFISYKKNKTYPCLLIVYFFKDFGLSNLSKSNFVIERENKKTNIKVKWIQRAKTLVDELEYGVINKIIDDLDNDEKKLILSIDDSDLPSVLIIRLDSVGDDSVYTLKLANSLISDFDCSVPKLNILNLFDNIFSYYNFNFKEGGISNFDCISNNLCDFSNEDELDAPYIDYTSKDFSSIQKSMIDFIYSQISNLKEKIPADFLITLIEAISFKFDTDIFYLIDSLSAEGSLTTATSRISMKRLLRLIDYYMHDGCNARTWIFFELAKETNTFFIPSKTKLLTLTSGITTATNKTVSSKDLEKALENGSLVFETMYSLNLYASKNKIYFYSWGGSKCCLPKGSISATLLNDNNRFFEQFLFIWEEMETYEFISKNVGTLQKYLYKNYGISWFANILPNIHMLKISESLYKFFDEKGNNIYLSLNKEKTFVTVSNDCDGNMQICELMVVPSDTNKSNIFGLSIEVGDVLVFEENDSLNALNFEDNSSILPHAIKISKIASDVDKLFDMPIIHIFWNYQDSLPYPLCIEKIVSKDENLKDALKEDCPNNYYGGSSDKIVIPVSIARGNIVLADHGNTITKSFINAKEIVSTNSDTSSIVATEFLGSAPPTGEDMKYFRPKLSSKDLTFAGPSFNLSISAKENLEQEARLSNPCITIIGEGKIWHPKRDLLEINEFDNNYFVVEMENDKSAYIRFPDLGQLQSNDDVDVGICNGDSSFEYTKKEIDIVNNDNPFYAIYRVGNGNIGNVGPNTIAQVVLDGYANITIFSNIKNIIGPVGGTEPEDMEVVRQIAPCTINNQERAVTSQDFQDIVMRFPGICKAFATFAWTGSWYIVQIAYDTTYGKPIDKNKISKYLDKYKLAGYEVEISHVKYIPIYIQMVIYLNPGQIQQVIEKKLNNVFSNQINDDGTNGFFYPGNFNFGTPVILSQVYKSVKDVYGVSWCKVTQFRRWAENPNNELDNGIIKMSYFEIARLDNDPVYPENGKIEFIFENKVMNKNYFNPTNYFQIKNNS